MSKIERRSTDLLRLLHANRGKVVPRGVLLDRVWPAGQGSDESLTQAIAQLRKAFGESGHSQVLLRTVPKRGYMLVDDAAPAPVGEVVLTAKPRFKPVPWLMAGAAALAFAFYLLGTLLGPSEQRTIIIKHLSPARPATATTRTLRR